MKNLRLSTLFLFIAVLAWGCTRDAMNTPDFIAAKKGKGNPPPATTVQSADVITFQPAGDFGGSGNVLDPGDFFPPGSNNHATLKRGKDYLQFNVHTTDLPQGAYTVWWIIFNDPDDCNQPNAEGGLCGGGNDGADLFVPTAAVLWATGKVVQANGVGNFSDRIYVGETRDETIILGSALSSALTDPQNAEVHLAIKYHGLASSDPDILYEQTHTLLGNCDGNSGANSYDLNFLPPPFGPYQCFDPQLVIFVSPE